MKEIRYNKEKNIWLKKKRGIDFEKIINLIKKGKLIKLLEHHNKKKYPKQKIFLVNYKNYIFVVPFIEEENYIFLKTIYPSHKYTKKYLKVKNK